MSSTSKSDGNKNAKTAKTPPGKPVSLAAVATAGTTAVVYDRVTGKILETHRRISIGDSKDIPHKLEELLDNARNDAFTLRLLSDGDKENLSVMEIATDDLDLSRMVVDTGSDKLVAKYQLQLTAKKTELEGDGKDSTEISIQVVDSKGKQVSGFNSEVEIRTSRGKLSARGGRLKISGGKGSIKLTSVSETIRTVIVSARSLGVPCESSAIQLSFL